MEKCIRCNKERDLVFCKYCANELLMLRAFDQTQDVADRVFWKISNRLDEYEEKIEKILQEHELNSKPHKGK